MKIADGKSDKYCINEMKVLQIEQLLKLLIMPRGLKAGQNLYECSCNYQWLFYISVLCIVYKDNPNKRRYETAILEIARKNFKTYTIATIFILLFLIEPKFSKLYSVAPDGSLSREVKTAIEETLKSSPLIYQHGNTKRFKILRDYIQCNLTESKYFPLNYSSSRLDGKLPNVFLADEVGALPNSYAIESMRSGQLNILNKLGCIISTKYPSIDNPFEPEVNYAKRVLDGLEDDETVFALLYEPDDIQNWTNNDDVLKHSNPVALEISEIWEDLIKKRTKAIAMENTRENFLTKHCNIIYKGAGTESFVDINSVLACRTQRRHRSHGAEGHQGKMLLDKPAFQLEIPGPPFHHEAHQQNQHHGAAHHRKAGLFHPQPEAQGQHHRQQHPAGQYQHPHREQLDSQHLPGEAVAVEQFYDH